MRAKEILYEMTEVAARQVFTRLGFDPANMGPRDLKSARNKLVFRHHPDKGGDLKTVQLINSAYDILSGKSAPERAANPAGGSGFTRGGGGYSGGAGGTGGGGGANGPKDTPQWAWAGYSGGLPPNSSIYRSDYTDVNFIKKSMWELSGQSDVEYSVESFDGYFFRPSFTTYGSPKIFNYMAQAMVDWQTKGGNPYECRAVLVSKRKSKELYVIYADGKFYGDNPIKIEHNARNFNPSNDSQFTSRLIELLDKLKAKQGG